MMLMFWIFALTDLFVAGIFYAVYGGKRKYAEGMLLGVHIPQSAADSEEVKVFMERYRKNTKRFYLWNGLAGVAVCFLNFWYLSVFMIVWSVWLVEFCAGAIYLLCRTHRKLYDLKVERGWVGSAGSRIMAVDTKVAAQNGKMGLSPWWHLLFLALILISFLDPGGAALSADFGGWLDVSADRDPGMRGVRYSSLHNYEDEEPDIQRRFRVKRGGKPDAEDPLVMGNGGQQSDQCSCISCCGILYGKP